jgi:hypothetical protein
MFKFPICCFVGSNLHSPLSQSSEGSDGRRSLFTDDAENRRPENMLKSETELRAGVTGSRPTSGDERSADHVESKTTSGAVINSRPSSCAERSSGFSQCKVEVRQFETF